MLTKMDRKFKEEGVVLDQRSRQDRLWMLSSRVWAMQRLSL